ncbi:gastrula zinc finger protein XlCGF49.1-like [Penaeus japonicus]|uniref:gastrula zinc finger protein XlCGF49.1-like n=1 Tax=Penaeus japonicus TaxID=27405 RepID=UPI001C714FAD|nr:gastrula zinc finger protein XlCGF49.1-like [Penaeus japonicus]
MSKPLSTMNFNERPFECTYCEKRFRWKQNLKQHIRNHTGDKPFECSYCNKRFDWKNTLATHLRIHTGEKPFKCTVCDKKFTQKSHLKKHEKIHKRPCVVKPCWCSQCGAKFDSKRDLSVHNKVHGDRKRFKCSHSEKKYEDTAVDEDSTRECRVNNTRTPTNVQTSDARAHAEIPSCTLWKVKKGNWQAFQAALAEWLRDNEPLDTLNVNDEIKEANHWVNMCRKNRRHRRPKNLLME